MDNIEKLLLIILFIAILYYPLCGVVGFIKFVQDRKRGINMAKLVIEISEEKLSIIKNKMYCGVYDPDLYKAIANGTPLTDILDKIRAEIKTMSGDIETIADVLDIFDKYMAEGGKTDI